jgi:hypothetical protein
MSAPLAGFIVVVVIDVLTLLFDLFLMVSGYETISGHVWTHPQLGVPLVLVQSAGLAALAWHLFVPPKDRPNQQP